MKSHGTEGKALKWIEAWLANQKETVQVDKNRLDLAPVSSGVQEGSVLGSLLLTIYINDLDCHRTSDISKFADYSEIDN